MTLTATPLALSIGASLKISALITIFLIAEGKNLSKNKNNFKNLRFFSNYSAFSAILCLTNGFLCGTIGHADFVPLAQPDRATAF